MATPVPPPVPLPKFVYKIVPNPPPEPIPGIEDGGYPLSELDQKDGFVHLSVGKQIPITASLFFSAHTCLWVLKLRLSPAMNAKVDWSVPNCPHLYANFGAGDVEEVRMFERGEGESWDAQEQGENGGMDLGWLE